MGTGEEDTALHEAVRYSDREEVLEALRAGHCPDQIGLYQWSALHEAAHLGELHILQLLLKHGGDPNKPDLLRACTAVHYAASQGHVTCLQALLGAGGRWDALDHDNKTCLDVATGDCVSILRRLNNNNISTDKTLSKGHEGDAALISDDCPRETLERVVLSDTRPASSQGSDIETARSGTDRGSESPLDPDSVSLASLDSLGSSLGPSSGSSVSAHYTPQAWRTDGPVLGVGRRLVLGQIQLSFEYNSKKSTFKIRVWQLTDLLLPPVETSMISGIYVKSYLLPDKRKDTKRKTEELAVYRTLERKVSSSSRSAHLAPASFHFTKAPEYRKVTAEMVQQRMVQLEVCIVQKYTRRRLALASWSMPLREAVRRLVKQSYALTPRATTAELPDNLRVYDAGPLTATSPRRPYSSHPTTRLPSVSSLQAESAARAASDTDLTSIRVEVKQTASIEIEVPDDDVDDLQHDLHQITIMERAERDQWTSIPMTVPGTHDDSGERSGRRSVVCDVHHVALHRPATVSTQNYANHAFDWKTSEDLISDDTQEVSASKKKRKFSLRNLRDRSLSDGQKDKGKDKGATKSAGDHSPRPDSPSWQWDNYMEPLQTAMEPVTFDEDFGFELDLPFLPMTTTLDIPRVHGNSFSQEQETSPCVSAESPAQVIVSSPSHSQQGEAVCTAVDIPEDVSFHVEQDALQVVNFKKGKVRPKARNTSPGPGYSEGRRLPNTAEHPQTAIELANYPVMGRHRTHLNLISNDLSQEDLNDIETILI